MGNVFHNSPPKSPAVKSFHSLEFHKNSIKLKINIYDLIPTRKFTGNFSLIISFILIFHC